jgi:hypothetical protein
VPTFILGRDDVSEIPGVVNDDIEQVAITYAGDELDATTFKNVPLTEIITQVGLVDVSIECTCTDHSATRGQKGAFVVGNTDSEDLGVVAQVMEIKKAVTPKGKEGYTISYSLSDPPPAP